MNKALPPTCLLVAIVLCVVLHFILPLGQIVVFPWRLLGLIPLVAGTVLNLMADREFKRVGTTVKPFEKSRALVRGGVFAVSRHPMYLGMVAVLMGIAVLLGSVSPFMVAPFYAVIIDRSFIAAEERMLEETFGDEYREYRRRVGRWI